MALQLLVGMTYLYRNPTVFPQLSLDSIALDGYKETSITYSTAEKFSFPSSILYDEITLKCTAHYAIKWVFLQSPIYNSHIKNIQIITEKVTAYSESNIINILFTSFLYIKLNGTDTFYNGSIGCQSVLSPTNVTWIEMGGHVNLADRRKNISTFRIFKSSKINSPPKKPGENKNCRTQLIVDAEKGQVGCEWKNTLNKESVSDIHLRNASNINEMDAQIHLQKNTNCQTMRYGRCIENCISTDYIQSSAIVYCGYGSNSLSLPIFRINSKLYFGIQEARYHSDLHISLYKKSFQTGIPYEFVCKGTYSLHMKGFCWMLNTTTSKDSYKILGNGVDTIENNNQVVSRKNIIFDEARLYSIYCFAPDWSSNDTWSNTYTLVNVSLGHNDFGTNTDTTPNILDKIVEENNETNPRTDGGKVTENSFLESETGIIILATVVSLFIMMLFCAILLVIAIRKIKKQSRQLQLITEEEIVEFEKGNPKAETALFLPYNMEFEIPKDQIHIGTTVLGEGHYGVVQKGRYGSLQVAVKTVKKSANSIYFKSLLSELKIMTYVGRHINIVHLVGACTKDLRKGLTIITDGKISYVCLVYEFCANGNMQQFLKHSRKTFGEGDPLARGKSLGPQRDRKAARLALTSWVENTNTCAENLTMQDLLRWSQQIASGLEYLTNKNIIHGDLAARNVLVTDKMHAKLADFGLSKQLFDYSIYIQKQHCPLPLKWMAPESLRDMEFSVQSDVWSYGVTLWEIYSLGELPYPGVDWNYESWKMLCDGYRMDKPKYASSVLYKMILECWRKDPNERPTFKFLKDYFGEELQQLLLTSSRTLERLCL